MKGPCWLLCWIAAGFLLCIWEVPTGSLGMPSTNNKEDGDEKDGDEFDGFEDNGGDCIPPTNSSAFMGLHGYRRYFANDSLIGRPVPCTRDEKICFRHNLVFNPITDRCEPLREECGENAETIVNRTELEDGSGRVVISCSDYDGQCSGFRMAYDGLCYSREIVRDIICGRNATYTSHILGGEECRTESITSISVQQPEEDGSCVIPDLINPLSRHSMLLGDPFDFRFTIELKCTPDQGACFSEVKIFVSGYDGCHTLLEQGPCAEEHVVVLDQEAAIQGRAEGMCVDVRGGCPKGYKRMVFDGKCHEDREIQIEAPGNISLNHFGRYLIEEVDSDFFFHATFDGNQTCTIQRGDPTENTTRQPSVSVNPFFLPCATDDSGKCRRVEVLNTPPKPIL